jgi:hypothetical protein
MEGIQSLKERSPLPRGGRENLTMGKENGSDDMLAGSLGLPRRATAGMLHNHAKPSGTNGEGGRVFLQHPVPLGKGTAGTGEQVPLCFAFLGLCPGQDGSQLRLGKLHHGNTS